MSNQLQNMNEKFEGVKKELDEMIVTLRSKIQKVLEGQAQIFTSKEHSRFYSIIYDLVLDGDRYNSPQGQKLYELYQIYQQVFLRKSAEIVKEKNENEKKLFEEFLNQDQLYTYHSKKLNSYFAYLNRSVVETHSTGKYCQLKDQAKKQFYQYLYLPFQSQLFEQLKYKLNQDRYEKDKETQKQLQQIFQIIINMDSIAQTLDQSTQNQKIFQSIFSESISFYQQQYNKFKQTTYIEQLEQLVKFKAEELDRIKTIFVCDNTLIQNQLIDHFNEQIIQQYAIEISDEQNHSLQFIIKSSLEIQQSNQMSQFLPFQELIKFLNGLKIKKEIQEKGKPTQIQFENVAKKFYQIIHQNGIEIINEKKSGVQFTKNEKEQLSRQQNYLLNELIKVQQKYKKLIETEAQDNTILMQSLRSAIEDITSEDQKYLMDAFLQKLNDYFGFNVENQDDLTNLIQLLDSFQAKDVFLKNYQTQLAHRLLTLFNLKNMEKEKRIIDQLKKICGPENTSPLEYILKEFESQQIEISIGEINVKPKILCKEFWPEFNPKFIIQLQQFDELKEAFKIKYNDLQSLNQVRDLTWQDQLSMVEIAFTTNKSYRMTISSLGAALLIKLDNNGNQLVIDEIQNMFGINDDRYLSNQLKLLERFNLVISDGQCLKFNENFNYNKIYFSVGIVVEKIVEYQQSDLYQDRKIAIEAAIVRIMKAKKKQSYLEIVKQVKEQLKLFRPKDYDIKIIVEHLMDKAYIKRDQFNQNEFIYIS